MRILTRAQIDYANKLIRERQIVWSERYGAGRQPNQYKNPFTGETKTALEFSREIGISVSGFKQRVWRFGLNDPRTFKKDRMRPRQERVLEHPVTKKKQTVAKWLDELGIKRSTLYARIDRLGLDNPKTFSKNMK